MEKVEFHKVGGIYTDHRSEHYDIYYVAKFIAQIANIGCGFMLLIVTIITMARGGAYVNSLNDIKDNWQLQPIVDIKTAVRSCPPGYESLIDRQWPGTVAGWDCTYSWEYYGLYTGYWDINQTASGWYTVYPRSAVDLGKFYSYKICGKRAGGNYLALKNAVGMFGENRCPTFFIPCGKGDVDYVIWVREGSQWPINDIIITDSKTNLDPSYSKAQLDNGLSVAFTNSSSNRLPVVRLKLTEGEVCTTPNHYEKSEGRYLYKLIYTRDYYKCSSMIAGLYKDPRYRKISSVSEDRLFEDNGVIYVIQNLPRYPISDSKKYKWNLYTNDYFLWSSSCEQYGYATKKHMTERIDAGMDVSSQKTSLLILGIIYFILCSVAMEIFIFNDHKNDYIMTGNIPMVFLSFAVKAILLVTFIMYASSVINAISEYDQSIESIIQYKCSDAFTNRVLQNYSRVLGETISWSNFSFIIAISLSVIAVLHFIIDLMIHREKMFHIFTAGI